MGPTVTRPVQDPLAVTCLENRLCLQCKNLPVRIFRLGAKILFKLDHLHQNLNNLHPNNDKLHPNNDKLHPKPGNLHPKDPRQEPEP